MHVPAIVSEPYNVIAGVQRIDPGPKERMAAFDTARHYNCRNTRSALQTTTKIIAIFDRGGIFNRFTYSRTENAITKKC